MIRNERGFTYPLTYITLIITSVFIAYYCEQYITEQIITSHSKTLLTREYYVANAIRKIEEKIGSGNYNSKGRFLYKDGYVEYDMLEHSPDQLKVTIVCQLNDYGPSNSYGHFDKDTGKMKRWVERK